MFKMSFLDFLVSLAASFFFVTLLVIYAIEDFLRVYLSFEVGTLRHIQVFLYLNRVRRGRESKAIMLRTEGYFPSGNWEFSQWNHPTVRVSMASGGLPKNTISEVNLLTRVTENLLH